MKKLLNGIRVLIILVGIAGIAVGCAITDPDWQARADAKPGMQPTTSPPPRQWQPPWGSGDSRNYGNWWGE